MTADSASQRIDLAREADFMLGTIQVRPSTRQVESGEGSETLEPRIMQVLVALARKRGQVVSRDELIESCWDGRVVGDDALNRCIAKIRKLGEAGSGFRLETIPRVGYRLWADGGTGAAPRSNPKAWRTRPALISAAVLLAVVLAGAIWLGVLYSRTMAVRAAPSVAVMPFVDRNGDQAHLAGGMTDELISRLRQTEGLTVAGGDWMPGLLKEAGDPQSVGKRLSVDHLLEGSIRQDGKRLRVSARLTSTRDGQLTWSEDYEKEVSDIFSVQDEIAAAVANALSVVLDAGLQSTHYGGTDNFEAYDHYLRGRALRNSRPADRVVEELRQAVAIDPDNARAWFELTVALGGQSRLMTKEEREPVLRQMDEASQKAEAMAPNAWFGHAARAWYHVGRNEWLAADQAFQRVLATGAKDPEMIIASKAFSHQVGRFENLLRLDEQLAGIDPYNPGRLRRHQERIYRRDFEGAWQAYKEDVLSEGKWGAPDFELMAMMALSARDLEGAESYFRSVDPLKTRDGDSIADHLDSPSEGLKFVRPLLDWPPDRATRETLLYGALMAGHFGDTELALEFLRRAYLGPGWAANYFIWYPQLKDTRRTEGFKQFVTDLGMVEMWRASGDWGDFCRPVGDTDFECA
jgi:TolB-like protein/DNA-binding winged helix-turn-helix (wHTH) protein